MFTSPSAADETSDRHSLGVLGRTEPTHTDPRIGDTGGFGITEGPDGALWFGSGNAIGRITTQRQSDQSSKPEAFCSGRLLGSSG